LNIKVQEQKDLTPKIPEIKLPKVIIFDSSSIINFTINGILEDFRKLREIFPGRFLITNEVYEEIITRPMQIKKFKFEAIKIKQLITDKVLELPEAMNISSKEISRRTSAIMDIANSTFFSKGNTIKIIDLGEASCLALNSIFEEKGIENVLAVDERTTRVLSEKPENLLEILNRKLHTEIKANRDNFKFFKGIRFIRSAELVFYAYKKGIIQEKSPELLDALLFSLKLNGCSISDEEIAEMKKLG
jgi:hypothetical protein